MLYQDARNKNKLIPLVLNKNIRSIDKRFAPAICVGCLITCCDINSETKKSFFFQPLQDLIYSK